MGELATVEKNELAPSMLEMVLRASADPSIDPARLREFLQIGRDLELDRKKGQWSAAFFEAKQELDGIKIRKNGKIAYEGKGAKSGGVIKFLRYDDISDAVKPILAKYGLMAAYSYRYETTPPKTICILRLTHRNGHFELFESMPMPMVDDSGGKNAIQGAGSVGSYGRRYVVCPTFDIVAEGEDDDGNMGKEQPKPITEVQARQLDDMVMECDNRQKGFGQRWYKWLGAEFHISSHAEILNGQMFKAVNAKIDEKARELGVL